MIAPLQRIAAITQKEFLQLGRDRLTFGMIVGIPLLQIMLFGFAINLDVRNLRAGVADLAQSARSRALVADTVASQVLGSMVQANSAEELEHMLQQGEIVVGIFIPPDFERRLQDPGRRAAQLLVDGSDPTLVGVANQLRNLPSGLRPGEIIPSAAVFEVRNFYNPERRSAVNIVPGLIGVILNLTMVLFTAIAIVRERERGNLELLITTPIRTPELMIGKIAPYILIGLIQVTIILLVGAALFNVPVRGSLLDLYIASLVFIAATLGLGLLISTLTNTQFQAMQLTIFTFLPSILLSGFMFPFDGMPPLAQGIAQVLPLTHFIVLVRGIVLKGASLGQLSHALLPLLAFFLVTMALAVIRFRKRLD
jgi:ABC-2 type transport system permease protein